MVLWHNFKEKKPPIGVEIIAYHHKWIDEFDNPNGTRAGFLNGIGDFISAHWYDYQERYMTISHFDVDSDKDFFTDEYAELGKYVEPEYWTEMPKFSNK